MLPTPEAIADIWEKKSTATLSEERAALLQAAGDDAVAKLVAFAIKRVQDLDSEGYFEDDDFWDEGDCRNPSSAESCVYLLS